jgi:uncharacterized damage-inducible protein DinB
MQKEVSEILIEKAKYNLWANQKIVSTLSGLTLEQLTIEIESSFKGIFPTLFHIWNAENIWLERIKGITINSWPNRDVNNPSNLTDFINTSELFLNFLEEKSLDKDFPFVEIFYANLKGDLLQNTVYEIVFHCFNHSTYHRGQIVTMLRQIGISNIPATDFIAYLREKKI